MSSMLDSSNHVNLSEVTRARVTYEAQRIVAAHVGAVKDLLAWHGVAADAAGLTAFAVRLYGTAFASCVKINAAGETQQQAELPLDASTSSTR
jgi:hypothetical protein